MNEKCRYGRDSEVFYNDSEGKRQPYECPHKAEVDGFCMFHKEGYWKQNKDNEERVRNAFMEELKNTRPGEELLCIGYHLLDIDVGSEIEELLIDVNFTGTQFQSINFAEVTFQGNVRFEHATFERRAWFYGATFKGWAGFNDTTFEGEAKFNDATFKGRAGFGGATFKKRTAFGYTTFKGPALFEDVKFIPDADIPHDNETAFIKFRRAKFDQPEEIVFDNCNLSYVSFIHTDISRVNFRNITWPESTDWRPDSIWNRVLSLFGKMEAYMLLDEELLERKKGMRPYTDDRDLTLENVLTVYRRLRENYEYNVDYETAGRFFVGEMEAKRRNTDSPADITVLSLYKWLALYGQSYTRPLFVLLGLIIFFAFWRGLLGGLILFCQGVASIDIVVGSILESFAVSLQLKGTEGVDIIQRILSIPLLVLFGLALRRRFERRFRH